MKTIEVEMEATEQKSSKFMDYFLPAVAISLGSILMSLIQVLSVFLLSFFELFLLVDGRIANLLILLLSQMIGAPIVYYGLISFFKVRQSEYHPITMNSFGKTIILFCLAFSAYSISNIVFVNICIAFDLIPQTGYTGILLTVDHLQNPVNVALFFIPTTIGAALFEELLFRRMLIPLLEQRGMSSFSAVFASSLVFALSHLATDLVGGNLAGGIIHLWSVFLLALALGMAYVLTRNVIFPIFIHALANFISFIAPLLILMEADILLLLRSFAVISIMIAGLIIGVNAIFKYIRGSPADWIEIIRKKSEYKITSGLIGFVIIGYLLISIPAILELSSLIPSLLVVLDFNATIGLLIAIYILFFVVLLYLGNKKKNDESAKLLEVEKSTVKVYGANKYLKDERLKENSKTNLEM